MPFSDYDNFENCVKKNKGKENPKAYCAEIKMKAEKLVDWNYHLSFLKLAGIEDDVMYIAGEASNPDKDEDGELMDMESLKGAYDSYMANPVIKFMHDKAPQWRGAIGKVIKKYTDSDGTVWETRFGSRPFLVAKFVKGTMPDWMWKGIQEGNYKGFSIGGKALKKVAGRIYVKSWLETSVVDVPSAHGAFFSVLKMACIGEDCPIEKEEENIPEKTKLIESKQINSFVKAINDYILDSFLENEKNMSDKNTNRIDKFINSFEKGGPGSGIKGHRTHREKTRLIHSLRRKMVADLKEAREDYSKKNYSAWQYHEEGEVKQIFAEDKLKEAEKIEDPKKRRQEMLLAQIEIDTGMKMKKSAFNQMTLEGKLYENKRKKIRLDFKKKTR